MPINPTGSDSSHQPWKSLEVLLPITWSGMSSRLEDAGSPRRHYNQNKIFDSRIFLVIYNFSK
jgi:hypothetical protein